LTRFHLSYSFHYEAHKQQISGFEDLGELNRTSRTSCSRFNDT